MSLGKYQQGRWLAIAAITMSLTVASWADGIGIASGNKTGTNWPMVEDITKVCSTPSKPIRNVVTNGGMDNLDLIFSDKTVQYGVVPEDTLVYEQMNDPKKTDKIVQIFPFFTVEVHLVVPANSPARTVVDLAGKRVIEGPDGSGSYITTQVIKAVTGIQWQAMRRSRDLHYEEHRDPSD